LTLPKGAYSDPSMPRSEALARANRKQDAKPERTLGRIRVLYAWVARIDKLGKKLGIPTRAGVVYRAIEELEAALRR
jgi:hypothetical protein